jgi:bacterioferritin-associated ferredoxin
MMERSTASSEGNGIVLAQLVRSAVEAEAPRSTSQVYGCLGCSAKCGRCARTIRRLRDEALGSARAYAT